jgi:hypothetical protein
MPEVVGEGIEELADRIAQLSERQAANVRVLLEEIERRRGEAREQGRNFPAPPEPRSWTGSRHSSASPSAPLPRRR